MQTAAPSSSRCSPSPPETQGAPSREPSHVPEPSSSIGPSHNLGPISGSSPSPSLPPRGPRTSPPGGLLQQIRDISEAELKNKSIAGICDLMNGTVVQLYAQQRELTARLPDLLSSYNQMQAW